MACEIVTVPGAMFCVWGAPAFDDVDRVVVELRECAREAGQPVVFVTRVPAKAPPPSSEVRSYINRRVNELLDHCSTYHVVMEGEGFGAAVKRAVLLNIFQLMIGRNKFYVHADVTGVLPVLNPATRATVSNLLELARTQGLLAPQLQLRSTRPP